MANSKFKLIIGFKEHKYLMNDAIDTCVDVRGIEYIKTKTGKYYKTTCFGKTNTILDLIFHKWRVEEINKKTYNIFAKKCHTNWEYFINPKLLAD